MVNLNSILYEYGHICMYNGSRWLSDFAQKSYITFSDEPNITTYFFRYQSSPEIGKCECYKGFIEDDLYFNDESSQMIEDFLLKEICPLIPGVDATKEEIDDKNKKLYFQNRK